ncbi:MAG: Crp/Fnr family transcriptional regulator, partial [Flavobacteriales bacterium]|nr:Crp/Fnr family transcriptional regulator [Flavobacteriales bacterium]
DLESFIAQKKSTLWIEALEDSQVLLLQYDDLEELYIQIPALERFFRILFSKAYVNALKRINQAYSDTAEERYVELIAQQKGITERIPLVHIASYIGVTPESLSRIRRKIAERP